MASPTVDVGLFGGTGGTPWDDGSHNGIQTIELSYKDAIGSFNVVYDTNNGPYAPRKHDSQLHFTQAVIKFNPGEKLSKVSGYTGPLTRINANATVVRSLTFETNQQRTFGPYGAKEGTPFSIPIEKGLIVGFKGRTSAVLDAIGLHVKAV